MGTTLVTAPQNEPLSLDEVKESLRVDGSDYDSELLMLIQEARRYVEQQTGRVLMTQTWDLKLDVLPRKITIPYPPLQSISSITYKDLDNATQTLASTYYTVDTTEEPARVNEAYGYSYPSTYPELNVITIRFIAGYGNDSEDVPERFKRAMKLYIQWAFDGDKFAKEALDMIIIQDKINWF